MTPPDMESVAGCHGRRSRWRHAGARPDAVAPARTAHGGARLLSGWPFDAGRCAGHRRRRFRRRGRPDGGWRAMSERAAAIVIGAGIGGLVASAYLAREGVHTLLLEKGTAPREPAEALIALDRAGNFGAADFLVADLPSRIATCRWPCRRDAVPDRPRSACRQRHLGQIQRRRCAGLATLPPHLDGGRAKA